MIIDLTHPLMNGITVYPGTPEPNFSPCNTIEIDGFAELSIQMTTHSGTHMDAPAHIFPNTKTLDQFPIEQFIGTSAVVDCRKCQEIDLTFLQSYEKEIRKVDFVLFYTGWQDHWNSPAYLVPFPVLTTQATQWLSQFNLKALGFDTISVDSIDATDLINHKILLSKEILIIENLTNLHLLLETGFEFHAIPIKVKNADGSPIRAFGKII